MARSVRSRTPCAGRYADRLDPLADPAIASLSDFYAGMDLEWSLPDDEIEVDVPAMAVLVDNDLSRAAVAGGRPPLVTDG